MKGNLSRRRARQIALQILYQIDVTNSTLDHALNNLLPETNLDFSEQEFCHALAMGVEVNKSVIDAILSKFAKDWSIERMSYIDRNILRLALYEILFLDDMPIKVSVNEAVELGKRFSDDKATKFINGVLGAVIDYIGRRDKYE